MANDEVVSMWKKHHEDQKKKRARNRKQSVAMLKQEGIEYESKNHGAHLTIQATPTLIIDFWPGTGKFRSRDNKHHGRGVRTLMLLLEHGKFD